MFAGDTQEEEARIQRLRTTPFDDPTFFPIGVWLQKPSDAARYKAAGINLYVGLWKGPTSWQLKALKKVGMRVIAAQNNLGLEHPDRDIIIGWMHQDEPDNGQPRKPKWLTKFLGHGPPISPSQIYDRYLRMLLNDPGRPVLLNLGQGVAWDGWHGRGRRSNHPEDYPDYVRSADIVTFDIYPVGHPHDDVAGRLDYVARGVSRLVGWSKKGQRVWNVIGASGVHVNRIKPTPSQVRSQVWMSIVHGSRGIIYFVHLFGGPTLVEAALLDDAEMLQAVTRLNREIQTLAPILNSPTVKDAMRTETKKPGRVATMVKQHEGTTYLFTAAMEARALEARFHLNLGSLQHAIVIGENRTIELKGGSFFDHFGPYDVHLCKLQ